MTMPLLYSCVVVAILTGVYHPPNCEANKLDGGTGHAISDTNKTQSSAGIRSKLFLSLVTKDERAPALDAFSIADNEATILVVDDRKIHQESRKLAENHTHRRGKQRHSRNHNDLQNDLDMKKQNTESNAPGRRICNTVSETTIMTEAVNNYGEKVQIASGDGKNGIEAGLHFHESYCETEMGSCAAIARSVYRSACQTQYRYTYAPTIIDGKIEVSLIKIRAGCNCIVQKKKRELFISILDYIG